MKKPLVSLLLPALLIILPFSAAAETESDIWWGSYYLPGNVAFSGGIGFGFSPSFNFSFTPGAELIISKIRIAETIPLDLGAAVRGILYARPFEGLTYSAFGVGGFATAHLGFRGISVPRSEYLSRFDLYAGLGLVYNSYGADWTTDYNRLGFGFYGGTNYFISDNLAVGVQETYWGYYASTTFTITYKLGKGEEITPVDYGISYSVRDIKVRAALLQFQTLYWSVFAMGGFMWDDGSYGDGDGTVWEVSFDGEDAVITRSRLRTNADGSTWWKAIFRTDDGEYLYEYLSDVEGYLLELRYRDGESGEVLEYIADRNDTSPYWRAEGVATIGGESAAEYGVGTETVRVKAGRYRADHLVAADTESGGIYEWWITDEVPGQVVKFTGRNEDGSEAKGELVQVLSGEKSELSSFR